MDDDDLLPPQREFKSNADFRQMLQTPRAQRADDGNIRQFCVYTAAREPKALGRVLSL